MSSELKFMDAGKKIEEATAPSDKKYYTRFSVDLDKFPDLEAGIDELIELHLKGRVCGINKSEYGSSMDVEVQAIAVPTGGRVDSPNEADKALSKMKGA